MKVTIVVGSRGIAVVGAPARPLSVALAALAVEAADAPVSEVGYFAEMLAVELRAMEQEVAVYVARDHVLVHEACGATLTVPAWEALPAHRAPCPSVVLLGVNGWFDSRECPHCHSHVTLSSMVCRGATPSAPVVPIAGVN